VKSRFVIVAALGVALALYLMVHVGLGGVFAAAASAGWGGFAILCLWGLGLFVPLGAAWNALFPDSVFSELKVLVWGRMVREAASDLLPFSHLGGIFLGTRAAIARGISQPLAIASTIVDVTAEMAAQIAYVALGIAFLSARAPHSSFALSSQSFFVIGVMLIVVTGALFFALRRYGRWLSQKVVARCFPSAVTATAAVTTVLGEIYRDAARLGLSFALHFLAWIASAIGSWIAFRLVGVHIDLASVIAIEGLVSVARSAAVIVPNALGVQEAAYAVLAPAFGVGAEFGIAVSLLKRARDIALGVPILLISHGTEAQRALTQR
jgi:glycosyltransferase 2 family protein